MTQRSDVAVIGGGITGLVAAHRIRSLGCSVVLLESSDRVGGVIQSEMVDGILLEHGPFSVMVRSKAFEELLAELGLDPIEADARAGRKRYVQHRGRLHAVPTSPRRLLTSSLLSPYGKARAVARLIRSQPSDAGVDITLNDLAYRRLGSELADRLVGPASIGIFAAEATELGVRPCMPDLWHADSEARSTLGMIRRLRRRRKGPSRRSLVSFAGGLTSLVRAIERDIEASVQRETAVQQINRMSDHSGFRLQTDGGPLEASAVIVACPAKVTSGLVAGLLPKAAVRLRSIQHASIGVVQLVLDRDDVRHPLDGFGYLLPRSEAQAEPVLGVIWPGSVFDNQSTENRVVLRAMVGGTRWPSALEASDDELIEQTLKALAPVLGITGDPRVAMVVRWPDSVPVYEPSHAATCNMVEREAESVQGLLLAGSWVCAPRGGLGVNDRVRHAREVADAAAALVGRDARRDANDLARVGAMA